MKKGILKKTGCILISASVILTGWTFLDSFRSNAALNDDATEYVVTDGETISATTLSTAASTLETVTGSGTVTIDTGAFNGFSALETVDLTGSVSIADTAFNNCEMLTSVSVGTMTSISPTTSFVDCPELSSISISNSGTYYTYEGCLYSGTSLLYVPAAVNSVIIKSGTTTIGADSFKDYDGDDITFEKAADITAINMSTDAWKYIDGGYDIYITAVDGSGTYVEEYFTNLNTISNLAHLSWTTDDPDDADDTVYTISLNYSFKDADDNPVTYSGPALPTSITKTSGSVVGTGDIPANATDNAGVVYLYESGLPGTAVTSNTTYTLIYKETTDLVSYVYRYYDTDGSSLLGSETKASNTATSKAGTSLPESTYDKAIGDTITYDSDTYRLTRKTYSLNGTLVETGSFTSVTCAANNVYLYTYDFTKQAAGNHTITWSVSYYDTDGTTLLGTSTTTTSVADGALPTYSTSVSNPTVTQGKLSGTYTYVSVSPTLVAATADATYTIKYKKTNSSDTSIKTYKITVYDVFYKADGKTKVKTTTRKTDTYKAGETYSYGPENYTGYELMDTKYPSGTVSANRDVYFYYKQTDGTNTQTSSNTGNYNIILGADQTVKQNGGPVKISCNGPMEKLTRVSVDDITIPEGKYTLESGSTILTMTYGYICSLPVGKHVVRFDYTDGYATTNLTVTAGKTTTTVSYTVNGDGTISAGHTKDTTPKTADGFDIRYLLCMGLFLLGAGTIFLSKQKRLTAMAVKNMER
ncbi:MAG: leucine-rich repeat domain-containing protein [Pseudobutyrivibrio sp.]|nr:leucine-rich repeat domain-containing protein [Pseudobutyrivibrio sp.]